MGPGLGGGFGRYQGYFGLVLDNIISMNVVLADGSMVTVSASSNPDLYWGMRGAGHNFGIVTSFNYKIHDQPVVDWFVETMIFTADKLEAFFEKLNALGANGTQPVGLFTYSLFAMSPEISKTEVSMPICSPRSCTKGLPASDYLHSRVCWHKSPSRAALHTFPYSESCGRDQCNRSLHRCRSCVWGWC